MKSQGNNGCFKYAILWCFLFWGAVPRAFCSEPPEPVPLTYESATISLGETSVYDTYLSPLKYRGVHLGMVYEQMKMIRPGNGNLSAQHLLHLSFSGTENPAKTAKNYLGALEYGYGVHYHFKPVKKIRFMAGLQLDGMIGGIYNTRNGNNPATAKAHLNLNLSGMAAYRLQIRKQPLRLRYQLNLSAFGVQFSPEYGQSYYEIDLRTDNKLIHLASFRNQLILRNQLSVEFPFDFCTLRLSYLSWVYETRINGLNTQILSHSFGIGFSRNFFSVRGRKAGTNFRTVFE